MVRTRIFALILVIAGVLLGYFVYTTNGHDERFAFRLGLDLSSGTHLIYTVDVSGVPNSEVAVALDALRDVIERRVNLFGVSEPIVQIEQGGILGSDTAQNRLIVELPGIADVTEAVALIGETPLLEFKLRRTDAGALQTLQDIENGTISPEDIVLDDIYQNTELSGRLLKHADIQFGSNQVGLSNEPIVVISFDKEGEALFGNITRDNVGEPLAIFLDGVIISEPIIQQEIRGGEAVISGNFSPQEARELIRNLNLGALPVPIQLLSSQSIGPSLGSNALTHGIEAGKYGLILISLFLIIWYRLPGLIAVGALGFYIVLMLALFKIIPVTLTAAGLAGFILSIGMAVDANILIFERIKDEVRGGTDNAERAIRQGFIRAWLPIRDGNVSSILTAVILFWFGTSLVEGFALVFGIGVAVSMVSAITITRTFLIALAPNKVRTNSIFGVRTSSHNT